MVLLGGVCGVYYLSQFVRIFEICCQFHSVFLPGPDYDGVFTFSLFLKLLKGSSAFSRINAWHTSFKFFISFSLVLHEHISGNSLSGVLYKAVSLLSEILCLWYLKIRKACLYK